MNTPAFPQKILKFFETSPVPVRRSGQAFMVIGPRIAANHSLLIQAFSVTCKTPRRSLRQLDETRRRIEKFYNYCSQSAAHQFRFKYNLKKLVAIAEASFSMQVVWIYLSRRRPHNIIWTYWNSLTNFVMSASSLNSFRTRLLNIPVHSFVLLSGTMVKSIIKLVKLSPAVRFGR